MAYIVSLGRFINLKWKFSGHMLSVACMSHHVVPTPSPVCMMHQVVIQWRHGTPIHEQADSVLRLHVDFFSKRILTVSYRVAKIRRYILKVLALVEWTFVQPCPTYSTKQVVANMYQSKLPDTVSGFVGHRTVAIGCTATLLRWSVDRSEDAGWQGSCGGTDAFLSRKCEWSNLKCFSCGKIGLINWHVGWYWNFKALNIFQCNRVSCHLWVFCGNRFEVDLHTGFERLLCASTRTDVILTEKHIWYHCHRFSFYSRIRLLW